MLRCRNYGEKPGCLEKVDHSFDMDFRDVEGGEVIHWCSACGPFEKQIEASIVQAFEERGDEFVEEFRTAIEEIAEKERREAH